MDYSLKEEGKYRFIEEGEGEVLLLLHGLFGALSNWKDVIDRFSGSYKVVIPMMPIYDMPVLTTSVKGLAKFIEEFVEFKGYSNMTVLGNSLGGHVALVYSLKNQHNMHSLVLTGSSGLYENAMGGSYPKRGDYEYIKKKVEYTFYDPATATKELVDEVFEITNDRMKTLKILAMAKSAIRHNMRKEVSKIEVPVCLIWGKNDNITPPDVAEEFLQLLPNAELHWLDKCGHAAMMERPEEFNSILDDFLTRMYKKSTISG
ncbi:MAG: abhydrolase domain-containing 18 [Bacteroidetes bacterium]|nr:MAG: abhydrolase domain-containing 18 [Bacteroidota bacterium]